MPIRRRRMVRSSLTHERPSGPMLRKGAGPPATRSRACGLRPLSGQQMTDDERTDKALFVLSAVLRTPASRMCVSPTWWSWRSGCTRSHSELGRETLQRQWYFVSRRGRVGRRQVCQTHDKPLFKHYPPPKAASTSTRGGAALPPPASASFEDGQRKQNPPAEAEKASRTDKGKAPGGPARKRKSTRGGAAR
jgi:hypothetical protein